MKKVAFIYFTYNKHEKILNLSIESLKEASKNSEYDIDIFVFDQGGNTISKIPDGVNYEVTNFDRGGNLNGLECVLGMSECYKKVVDLGYDFIFKIDSDTFVNKIPEITGDCFAGEVWNSCAMNGEQFDRFSGGGYGFSGQLVYQIYDKLQNEEIKKEIIKMECEDVCFSYLVLKCGYPIKQYEKGLVVIEKKTNIYDFRDVCFFGLKKWCMNPRISKEENEQELSLCEQRFLVKERMVEGEKNGKRNIAVVYFTFGKDEKLLEQSIHSVQRLKEDWKHIEIFVVDDANEPLSKIPDRCTYLKTWDNRKNNLRGKEWIRKEATILRDIIQLGFEFVIKVDSDTWINTIDYLKDKITKRTYSLILSKKVYGATIPLNKVMIDNIFIILGKNNLYYQLRGFVFRDDHFFKKTMKITRKVLEDFGNRDTDFVSWYDDNMNYDFLDKAYSIDFKEVTTKDGNQDLDQLREEALKRMITYRKHKDENSGIIN